ncbi:MAG: anaerobic ribonucleoside-triphosphate reductase activating protein [Eubacterium sp.]|nr:anaerobic ribonucleoside-triphosphate reductase activating protein [Eubacterium sp.]MCH4046199.1 anaerobic ribonucleoside-triphosphate reductase activating protein [Eubacterium sp.]MCH4079294.1 anaerobic ribonucleoside-triphosphate reductase activating protein [Eubacterium sp.]MCH4110518.1 anaerobic ribonucleoside-triphosphate reductase activating protein [Eubacterium sp.]MCI1307682.1 anaerobic ribonucleoside-triphosphate reductase activating protein [Eubacterium sp.]
MYYGNIKNYDVANGLGVRVSLFVSGCRNHCEGCFQPETWDFKYGKPFTKQTEQELLDMLKPDYIAGFTCLGGEPFEPENQEVLAGLFRTIKETYPKKTIWCYTGYRWGEDLAEGGSKYTPYTDSMLNDIDVLVDGRFVMEQKDITLHFRGSRNQRILNPKTGEILDV